MVQFRYTTDIEILIDVGRLLRPNSMQIFHVGLSRFLVWIRHYAS